MKNNLTLFIKNKLELGKEFITRTEALYFFVIFLISLAVHFCVSLIGWNNLLYQYGFRQTQTAITTYYIIKEGFKLNYITPILGAPWSIPFEFPLFQWMVAIIVVAFKTPIDQTGRFLSLVFFYLSLVPLYAILKVYLKKAGYVFIILSLVLLNPIYLFWSRTFMIESLALFLAILFCWLVIKLFQTNKTKFFILVSIVGSLAALVKITTFIVLCMPMAFLFIYFFFREGDKILFSWKKLKKYLLYGIFIFIIPIMVAFIWTHFADAQKSINPLAEFLTSKALTGWNFGTLAQRIDLLTWKNIFKNSLIPVKTFGSVNLGNFLIPGFFLFLILFFYFAKYCRKEILLALIFFLSGPLIFMNLYFVHEYYFYANNLFLSILLGFLIISFHKNEKSRVRYFGIFILFPFLLMSMFLQYKDTYYPVQVSKEYPIVRGVDTIKKYTKPDDIIFIYGQDWDSTFSYYAERKTIMDQKKLPFNDRIIQESIKKTGKISALVISNTSDKTFILDSVRYFNFNETPIYSDEQTSIYLPK